MDIDVNPTLGVRLERWMTVGVRTTCQTSVVRTGSAGEVLTAMAAMFHTGEVGAVEAIVHPDYVDHQGLGGEPMYGPSGFATVVTAARSGYEALYVTVEDLLEQGVRAAARLRWRCTCSSGEFVERETLRSFMSGTGLLSSTGADARNRRPQFRRLGGAQNDA